jgi:hypothetical protein
MSQEFQKTGANAATSSRGFTVEVQIAGGVIYRDSGGETRVESEWLKNPFRILMYPAQLRRTAGSRAEEILADAKRALEYLGYQVELWPYD